MSTAKHTPGPWRAGMSNVLAWNSETGAWAKISGHHKTASFSQEEGLANLKLAAAAPELLEALEMMLIGTCDIGVMHSGEREVLQIAVDHARTVIDKATGEQS